MRALCIYLWIALVFGFAGFSGIFTERTSRSETGTQFTKSIPLLQDPTPSGKSAQLPAILETGEYHFDQLTTSDGLSQSTVTRILQDQHGFLWFGTASGLNKYDGYTFTVYRYDPEDPNSIRGDTIRALFEDVDGILWVGTSNGWIERYDRERDKFSHIHYSQWIYEEDQDRRLQLWIRFISLDYQYYPTSPNISGILNQTVSTQVLEDSHGKVWVGDTEGWLHEIDSAGQEIRPIPLTVPVENYNISALHEDSLGNFWVGRNGGGLSLYDRETGKFTHYRSNPSDPNSLTNDGVTAIAEAQPGYLWIGTWGGLEYFNIETGKFRHFRSIPGDQHSLSDDAIMTLYKDRTGILWIGTASSGINKLDPLGSRLLHIESQVDDPNSLISNWITEILIDREGVLWVGTIWGLNRYDASTNHWVRYHYDPGDENSLNHDWIMWIYEDRSGRLWIGTPVGMNRYERNADHFIRVGVSETVSAFIEDRSGVYWAATDHGLSMFNPEVAVLVQKKFSEVTFVHLMVDSTGLLWIGTMGDGIWNYDGKEFKLLPTDPNIAENPGSNIITALYEDSANVVWVGTTTGLDRYNREAGTFTRYTVKDGLPSNNIQGILEDDEGNLWLSTLAGVSRMEPATGSFHNFDYQDGLQSNNFSEGAADKGQNGELYFGGYNGISVFQPGEIVENTHIPPVIITKVNVLEQVIRKDLPPGEQITLSYKENTLSFEFVALDYSSPDKNQYAYRMDGVDADWVNAGTRRFAEYRNMQPGDYTFRVKGSNNDGIWNEEGASVQITITPPFWRTGWFAGVIILIIGGITIGIFRLRVRSVEARSHELAKQVEVRTRELSAANEQLVMEVAERERAEEELSQKKAEAAVIAERNRLARDLHDSVTQSLYGVTLYSDAVNRLLDMGSLLEVKNNLSKLHATAMEALGEMRLLVFELHPPILEQAGLASAIQERLDIVERRSGKQVNFKIEGEGELPLLTQEGLYRIAQEALNNTLKHSQAQKVDILLRYTPEGSLLEIRDDGIGFDVNSVGAHSGLGLRNMHERAKQLGGELSVESQPGEGTHIRVEIARDR